MLGASAVWTVGSWAQEESNQAQAASVLDLVSCAKDDPPRIEFTSYVQGVNGTVPDSPEAALREYLSTVGPDVDASRYKPVTSPTPSPAFADGEEDKRAAAVATPTDSGWRVTIFAACSSYVTMHPPDQQAPK